MYTLDDEHDFPLSKAMDFVIGPAHVCKDGQFLAVLVQQDGVVRRYEPIVMAADQDAPRVLTDESADGRGIVDEVMRV